MSHNFEVPSEDSFLEPIPDNNPENNPKFNIDPEQDFIDKAEEDEVEEINRHNETPLPEGKLDSLEVDKKLIELRTEINKYEKEMEIADESRKKQLREFLERAKSEFEKWLNYR